MNLNDSNQLHPQLDQVAKVLPLTWASKLCARVYEYIRYEDIDGLKEIARAKKPVTMDITNEDGMVEKVASEIEDEKTAVAAVEQWFDLVYGPGSGRVWSEKLDGKMLYL
jgi:hypothetical protein